MDFRFIDDGTRMDIQLKDSPDAPQYFGIFVKMDKGVSFLLSCDPLHECMDELDLNKLYTFTFFRGAEIFTFDGKLIEKREHFHDPVVFVTATTLIKSFSRRGAHRIRVQMTAKLFEGETQLADCPMHDVSRGGLTLLSNESIPLQLRKTYMTEFTINNILFRFPIEYVRGSERSLSPIYRYDYAFMFSGEDITADLNRMTVALLEQQLRGRK